MTIGTKQYPYILKSVRKLNELKDDDWVRLPVKAVKLLQESEPLVKGDSNCHEIHDEDPAVPASPTDYMALNERIFDVKVPQDEGKPCRQQRIPKSVVLTDQEKIVLLGLHCLDYGQEEGMPMSKIATAMALDKTDVRRLRYQALRQLEDPDAGSGADYKPVPHYLLTNPFLQTALNEEVREDEKVTVKVSTMRMLYQMETTVDGDAEAAPHKCDRGTTCAAGADFRSLHRLYYGHDIHNDKSFQLFKRYLGSGVALNDREKLIVLTQNGMMAPMPIRRVARALSIQPSNVRRLLHNAMQKMKRAKPAEMVDEQYERLRRLEAKFAAQLTLCGE